MLVATGAMLYYPFHQTVYYLPFLLLLLHNPAERIFWGGSRANKRSDWTKEKQRTDPWSCWFWRFIPSAVKKKKK